MRLTVQTDYALRTLMFLAAHNRRATAGEVAKLYGISANHVSKVVSQLSRFGFVRCVRGIGGGFELARLPEDIRVGEVIEKFEGNMHLLQCVDAQDMCAIQSFCKLRTVLAEAERVQMDYLNRVTLRDVSPNTRQLRSTITALLG